MITFESLGGGEHRLRAVTDLPLPPETVFPFFAAAENLERITPPELAFEIVTPGPIEIAEGTLIDYRLRLFGVPFPWRTRITGWDPPRAFTDEQVRGPYRLWVHTHTFTETADGTRMEDRVRFRLPLGGAGALALPVVRWQLRRIFDYRASALRRGLGLDGRTLDGVDATAT